MRARDMACAGNADVVTPNLDRLAASGLHFTNATSCIPVCTPARACLLTGRFPLTTGMFLNDLRMSTRERTIAHVLAEEGYETAYVGKWHLDGVAAGRSRHRGHDVRGLLRGTPCLLARGGYAADPARGCATDWETDTALSCIDGFTKPWALMLSWSTPHNPYHQLPKCWYRVYDPERLKLPPNTSDMPEN